MGQIDFLLLLLVYLQPPFLGLLLFTLTYNSLNSLTMLSSFGGVSRNWTSVKFFECATYSRQVGGFYYDLQVISLGFLFILYDVDLFFFFAEATLIGSWDLSSFGLFLTYLFFFILGLWYDKSRYSLNWSL